MKKITTILLLSFALCVHAKAQKVVLEKTLLYKISGNGLEKDSYLYLTGISCEENLKLNPAEKSAIQNVTAIAVEYDLYGSKDANKLAANNIALVDSLKIKNSLTPTQWNQFENTLKNVGYPEQAVPQMQSFKMNMAYYMLLTINGPCGLERQPLAFEIDLKQMAKKANKEYLVLQNIDEFLSENNSHTNTYWRQNISYVLNNQDNVKLKLDEEANLYKTAQIKNLQTLYKTENIFKLQHSDGILNTHVNFIAAKIQKQIQLGSIFIAINLSNVVFEGSSVLEILAQKGFNITAVLN